jgi:hypothetical protein
MVLNVLSKGLIARCCLASQMLEEVEQKPWFITAQLPVGP